MSTEEVRSAKNAAAILLCAAEELPPGTVRGFRPTPELSLLAVRTETGIHAYRNRCPHAGFELNWLPDRFLDHSGQYLHCQTHGALFDQDTGRCLAGPCVGAHLEPIAVLERDGSIYCAAPPDAL